MIVDAHNDVLLELVLDPEDERRLELVLRRGDERPFERYWLPQLEAGGVGVQICPLYGATVPREEARAWALAQEAEFTSAVEQNAERVCRVRVRDELDDSRLGLVLSMEGGEPLDMAPRRVRIPGLEGAARGVALGQQRGAVFFEQQFRVQQPPDEEGEAVEIGGTHRFARWALVRAEAATLSAGAASVGLMVPV